MSGWAGMTDILTNLKRYKAPPNFEVDNLLGEAVYEIERLRKGLQEIKDLGPHPEFGETPAVTYRIMAARILEGK